MGLMGPMGPMGLMGPIGLIGLIGLIGYYRLDMLRLASIRRKMKRRMVKPHSDEPP